MPGRIKIGVDELETLNDIFTIQNEFGPFVKGDPNDLKAVLMMMSKGTEEKSTKVNKEHLFNIIKALLMQLKLAEKSEVEVEDVQNNTNQSKENVDEKDENKSPSEVKNEKDKGENDNKDLKDKVCYFFRTKTCKHGKSGKECSYNHPKSVCMNFKNYGDTDKGCQDNQCKKMHVVHCKHFMSGKCDHGKKCKFFHQKNLQKKPQEKKNNQHWGTKSKSNEKSSENIIQRAPKNAQKSENIDFLCQNNPHQMACGNCSCRTNSHFCPQQKQVHQCSQNQNQDQNQNNPNQIMEVFSKIVDLIKQSL